MITAEFKVNGESVGFVAIHNDGTGATANEPNGLANYDVTLCVARDKRQPFGSLPHTRVLNWNRSGPAHELVRLALEALHEAQAKMNPSEQPKEPT